MKRCARCHRAFALALFYLAVPVFTIERWQAFAGHQAERIDG